MIINLIWIDPNVGSEKKKYAKDINKLNYIKLKTYKKVDEAIIYLKSLKFEETIVIISGRPYSDFVSCFKHNITKISAIQIISVITKDYNEFLKYNKDYYSEENAFYSAGKINTIFSDLLRLIKNNYENTPKYSIEPYKENNKKSNKLDEVRLYFENINSKENLILPLLFKSLIENVSREEIEKYIDNLYYIYSEKSNELKNILHILKKVPKIPVEILSKYFIRLYSLDSSFYKNINKDLQHNKMKEHLPFIKVLYDGIKTVSLPFITNVILYYASKISMDEINKIKYYLNNKINDRDFSKTILYTKTFLSFTKDKYIAERILNLIYDKSLIKVLYILEKDESIDYNLATNVNMEEISFDSDDKDVLFFPFSSFEISGIKEIKKSNEIIYQIKLSYLGKYLKETKNLFQSEINLPESDYKNSLFGSGLINLVNKGKNIFNEYQIYEKAINENNNYNFIYGEIKIDYANINEEIQIINYNNYSYDNIEQIENNCSIYIND